MKGPWWLPWWAGVIVFAAVFLFGLSYCRDRQREQHGAAQQAVTDQQAVVAKQDSIVIRDTVKLNIADKSLKRQIDEYKKIIDAYKARDLGTVPKDTATDNVVKAADGVVKSCTDYNATCRETTADFLQLRLDHLELERRYKVLVETPRPRRRWGLGCAGGYGAVVSQGAVRVGPGASCGVAISF